ncbi:DUF1674 domain-containing protein [Temperatibacter marinus]|uniref:DUF1674 domain-containing protein n=1 Tax=Temperatibacter marinus TaxID=1456591 RepID=A0AA52H9X9_9PROT|nr:DUF1674 domain-containing protein [Temperatibacter marinus]WND03384.1 DUF1674 domain-containing protein [Temperatibacter marinus]
MTNEKPMTATQDEPDTKTENSEESHPKPPKEIGGYKGPEPTRYGDWEKKGLISDF